MSRQDKATTERNAKTLRELLKRPENKVCADCKRNDPRWASWNLGVYLCIRCSGIHRSMGTHISKVKSVDLDVWTPEQMASIQKWGNRLANLYWEAHLKAGHVPPDHKMESFIRSKYESRRWAREGPPPEDPSTLDDGSSQQAQAPPAPAAPPATTRPTHAQSGSISAPITSRQPQPHQLLSTTIANRTSQPSVAPPQQAQPPQAAPMQQAPAASANDLFTLDFHNPAAAQNATTAAMQPKKDVKQDILSLFSTSSPMPQHHQQATYSGVAAQGAFGQFGGVSGMAAQPPHNMQMQMPVQSQNAWGVHPAPAQPSHPTSMMGNSGVGMWGASSGWNVSPPAAQQQQSNLWGGMQAHPQVPQQQPGMGVYNSNDIWGSAGGGGSSANQFGGPAATAQKKDDAFGDIWGGFK